MAKQNEVVEFVIGNYLAKKTSRKCTYCEVYTGIDQTNSKVSVEVKLCPIENGFNVKMLEYEAKIRKEILKNGRIPSLTRRLPLQVPPVRHSAPDVLRSLRTSGQNIG